MPKHVIKPRLGEQQHGYIGKNPSITYVGNPIMEAHQYLNNYSQNGQIFSYSGPPDDTMNDTPGSGPGAADYVQGLYFVILGGADKNDTSNPNRNLGGALLPWKFDADWNGSAWDGEVSINWQPPGGASQTIVGPIYAESSDLANVGYKTARQPERPIPFTLYKPHDGTNANFSYNPAASGYNVGILTTTGIQTAALGIWTMPDPYLTEAQHHWFSDTAHSYLAAGRCIRGYTGTGEPSLGDLIHHVGDTAKSDSLLWNTQRCLFQWGHPVGVFSDGNTGGTYEELYSGARYVVRPQNFREQPNTETTYCEPAIVVTSDGASSGDKAYVRITSYDSTPSQIGQWECGFYANAVELCNPTDGTPNALEINAHDESYIKIEIKPSSSGEMLLHSVALWQQPEW